MRITILIITENALSILFLSGTPDFKTLVYLWRLVDMDEVLFGELAQMIGVPERQIDGLINMMWLYEQLSQLSLDYKEPFY